MLMVTTPMLHVTFGQEPGDFIVVRPIIFYVVNRISEHGPEIIEVTWIIGFREFLTFLVQAQSVQRAGTTGNE